MNKGRLEAYTDGVLAIVATIMVLELHVPSAPTLAALVHQESGYFLVYLISFICVGSSLYNHHFLFSITKSVSKLTYWVNNIWLFSSYLLPFATAWAGHYPNSRTTEFFYLAVNLFWALSYHWLSQSIVNDNKDDPKIQATIKMMPAYRSGRWYVSSFWIVLGIVGVMIMPILGLVSLLSLTAVSILSAPRQQFNYHF